jgi:hypothetical protein
MEAVRRIEDAYNCTFLDAVKQAEAYQRQHPGELGSADRAKRAEREHGARAVEIWNAACPPGTRVAVRIVRGGPEYETTTRSAAWQLGHGEAVVSIEGRSGGWSLDFIRVLDAEEALPALPEKGQVAA